MTSRRKKAGLIASDGQSLARVPTVATAFGATVATYHTDHVNVNVAHSGTTYAQRSLTATDRVDRWLGSVSGRTILLDCGGTSDIDDAAGLTAAQVISGMESYWNARKTAGWDYVIATTIPDNTNYDAAEDTKRSTVNASIIASTVLNGVVNLATITTGGLNFELFSNSTTFEADGVHWKAAAATAVGDALETRIAAL